MITDDEIARVAALMRVEAAGADHAERLRKMVGYLDTLEAAGAGEGEAAAPEAGLGDLREDRRGPGGGAPPCVRTDGAGRVRAPRAA